MSTLIDEIRADLLELKESYHVMLGLERQRLAHQAGYCRGRGWSDLAAQFDEAGKGDDLAQMMEEANALIKLVMERIMGVGECDDEVTRLPVVALAHFADGTTREYRGKGKGNVTGPPAQGSGAASMTGLTGVTGEDLSDKTDPADQADQSYEQKGGPAL